jgi:hypothetical protein
MNVVEPQNDKMPQLGIPFNRDCPPFVQPKIRLTASSVCDQVYNSHCYELGHICSARPNVINFLNL